jgi:uncharacterized protein (TIGR02145 family)
MTLLAFVSDSGKVFAGIKLKESDTTHWKGPDIGATNESGFTALPGGYRDDQGIFMNGGNNGYWRSSTVSNGSEHFFGLSYKSNGSILAPFFGPVNVGLSVRCLKDN